MKIWEKAVQTAQQAAENLDKPARTWALEQLKTALGGTYGCDTADDEDWMTNYYGLDMSKIDSWASESCSISSIDPSTAVVLRVKDGYALDAAGESDWFLSEAKKVDAAWSDIFGTAENQIVP